MAHDLIFGKNKRNFSRVVASSTVAPIAPVSDEVTLVFSDSEKAMLDKISTARMKAEAGDRNAIKTLLAFSKDMSKIKAKAAKGDPKAKRVLLVLRESGLFNKPQNLSMLGLSLFSRKPSEDSHAKDRRAEKFEEEISLLYKPDQISNVAKMIAFNPEYRAMVEAMAKKGIKNAGQILAEAKKVSANPAVAMKGSSEDKVTQLRTQLRQLRQKDPKTQEDRQAIEVLSEKLARVEAMSGIGAYNPARRAARRAKRARKIANLKSRAAAGDPRAVARLQAMQRELNQIAPSAPPPYTPVSTPYTPAAPVYPQTNPYAYQQPVSAPPPYYQADDGTFYQTQPQPGQASPAIDVFVGRRSQRVDEEIAADQEDRGIISGSDMGGKSIPHENYRVAVMKAALKSSGGKRPTTRDYFKAKATVDQVIGKSGITIYMPGAMPGRRTI